MKTDMITKALLLAIACFLGVIALRPLAEIGNVHAGSGAFDYIKPLGSGTSRGTVILLDTRNGDVWEYAFGLKGKDFVYLYLGTLTELGKPANYLKKPDWLDNPTSAPAPLPDRPPFLR